MRTKAGTRGTTFPAASIAIAATAAAISLMLLPTQAAAAANLAQKLSRSHFEFSLDLYERLVADSGNGNGNGNLVYSPYSVQTVLSMLFLGTTSNSGSSRQLRHALKYDNMSYVDVHSAFKKIVENFDDLYYAKKVRNANGVFVRNGVAVSAPYDRALREFYRSRVNHVDFARAGDTAKIVNEWVGDVTDGEIPDLLSMPPADDTKLLLVNAMAMEARWLFPFKAGDTFEKGLFFPREGKR